MDIKEERYEIEERIRKENNRHDAQISSLMAEIRMLQKRCKHENHQYYGDPSGNNDSFYQCDDCEKQW